MSGAKSSFEELRAKCLKEGRLYEDPDFPAVDKSIYTSKPVSKHITWKRPPEFSKKPQFAISGLSRFDLDQGSLGNCWFIAAAATLATKQQLLQNVVPPNQSFTENYAGIFHFFFWRYGEWKEVIIDDRLPVKYGTQLEFCRNNEEPDEFWSALLEKAYAKLNGSFEALLGGNIQDALVDLTGGVSEIADLTDKSQTNDQLYSTMEYMEAANTLMGCSISVLGKSGSAAYDKGLLSGHAYSITGLTTITDAKKKTVQMIRLLNPWGKAEWTGPWSDGSSEWNGISEETKTKLQFRSLEDGEFWMPFDQWRTTFTQLQLCYLTSKSSQERKIEWFQESAHGEWTKGVNAGGCGCTPNEKFYWDNPQYCIIVNESDDCDSKSSLIISLMQKEKRELNKTTGSSSNNITIGFRLFQIKSNKPISLDNTIFPKQTVILEKGKYDRYREVAHHYDDVKSGVYCVIPTTYNPNEEASFFLRVLTHHKAQLLSDPAKSQSLKDFQFSSVKMSLSRNRLGMGIASVNINSVTTETFQEVREETVTAEKIQGLGQSSSWDSVSDATDGDQSYKNLTAADRDILEVFDFYVTNGQTNQQIDSVDFTVLRRILMKLNDIGQLGSYTLNFSETDSKILFRLVSPQRHLRNLTFEQLRNLVNLIKQWVRAFSTYDRDYAEFITFRDLWKALSSLDFKLNDETKEVITKSYGQNGEGVSTTEFISFMSKIHAINVIWKTKTQNEVCNISFQELLEIMLLT